MSRRLGVVEWFEVGEHERAERVCVGLRALGVERVRTGVSWADWHRPGGPAWYAWLLPRLAKDFELLPCLHHTPPSLGVVPTVQSPPRRPRDYADFLDQFLDRYGDLIDTVELWNEPNNLNDWDWTLDPDWNVFCEMIGDAAHWARQRGKRTVLGGMCPLDANWLGLLGQRGLFDVLDAVGIHAFPGSWTTVWRGWPDAAMTVREVLDRHGSSAELWVTEAGFSTWRSDEVGQLRALLDALDAPVDRLYWYAAEDLDDARTACDGFHVDERHYRFGLSDSSGRPKLAARALVAGGIETAVALAAVAAPIRGRRRSPVTVVTGGAGFVGTNLTLELLRRGERVRIVDNLSRAGVAENMHALRALRSDRLELAPIDVRDRIALREAVHGATSVFHLAAQVAVTTAVEDPSADFDVNLGGTITLLEELRRLQRPPSLVFTSTNKVYGSLSGVAVERNGESWSPIDDRLRTRGVDELRPLDFCTPYGCSKGGADQYVLDYAKTFGLPTTVFRMSCIYGPHQHGNEDQGWVAHFLIRARAGQPVTIYGDGAQVRDILYVDDLVRAFLLARGRIDEFAGTAFNIGGGPDNAISLLRLLDLIHDLHGARPPLSFAEERVGDQRWYASDTTRLREATGWSPQVGAEEGIETLFRWLAQRDSLPAASAA
ncbi:MAG: NAD-dependent epimerase/dehydratase family protein [Gaiellaceae bacterium]